MWHFYSDDTDPNGYIRTSGVDIDVGDGFTVVFDFNADSFHSYTGDGNFVTPRPGPSCHLAHNRVSEI
jgi:hypothetical protein